MEVDSLRSVPGPVEGAGEGTRNGDGVREPVIAWMSSDSDIAEAVGTGEVV